MENQYVTLTAAAKYLCISRSKLWKLCHRKEIRYFKMGNRNVFHLGDLDYYIRSHEILTTDTLKKKAEEVSINAKRLKL